MALLLDTTVLIDVLRGRAAAERLRSLRGVEPPPYVCAVNAEELWRGCRPGDEYSVQRLLTGLRIAPLGREQGALAGRWRRDFAAGGVTLSQADCPIAAAAVGVSARLATGNPNDFPMTELALDHWPTNE